MMKKRKQKKRDVSIEDENEKNLFFFNPEHFPSLFFLKLSPDKLAETKKAERAQKEAHKAELRGQAAEEERRGGGQGPAPRRARRGARAQGEDEERP